VDGQADDTSSKDTSTKDTPSEGTSAQDGESGKKSSTPATGDKPTGTPAGDKTGTPTPPGEGVPPKMCDKSQLDLTIKGLPGKISAGSGWHKFTLNVYNSSDAIAKGVTFFAGASSDKNGDDFFASKKVALQALNPQTNVWEDLNEDGQAVGYVGETDQLEPDYEVNIPLRINVTSAAPAGAGFTLGAGVYLGADDCVGDDEVAYRFRIVAAGTDTSGTKPQEGGQAPVPTKKPVVSTTAPVESSLAETGSSSMTSTIGIAGGLADELGAGALYVVRRRKAGSAA
jgi:hypothetical protein